MSKCENCSLLFSCRRKEAFDTGVAVMKEKAKELDVLVLPSEAEVEAHRASGGGGEISDNVRDFVLFAGRSVSTPLNTFKTLSGMLWHLFLLGRHDLASLYHFILGKAVEVQLMGRDGVTQERLDTVLFEMVDRAMSLVERGYLEEHYERCKAFATAINIDMVIADPNLKETPCTYLSEDDLKAEANRAKEGKTGLSLAVDNTHSSIDLASVEPVGGIN